MKVDPFTLVILGATGDLTRRLLFPAVYRLFAKGRLPDLKVVGYAMEDWSTEQFQQHLEKNMQEFVPDFSQESWEKLKAQVQYVSGDLTPEHLKALEPVVQGNALFYLALPPQLFDDAAIGLGSVGLQNEQSGWRRLIIEKPFGWDLQSAQQLREKLHQHWQEPQLFRIDHFLGKETVQNLMVFRFANRFMEPIWNSANIAQVQITAAETLGLEGRYKYYDQAGALRDMLQNHLMQIFALTAIEPVSKWNADNLRQHKVEVLQSVRPIPQDRVKDFAVRGRYGAGEMGGKEVPGYMQEEGVPQTSRTETFAAVKLYIDNWRWEGVPFYLRSGKRMQQGYTELAVQFKEVPTQLFSGVEDLSNWLIFRMKPEERIDLVAYAKTPGLDLETRTVVLSTDISRQQEIDFTAYEQLIMDAAEGDQTHFLRFDEVEEAWRILDPILKAWEQGQPEEYASGSLGPNGQGRLMDHGHYWRSPEDD
ncbi:glucose-6-phosphate dehydrogenase [Deinococcus roseus]|uniref:Glucose-6-phosphate 1-dehydrogenase n=1 Tax=Deinococcus roseus TaxID=392414 RepID=A0ABQ2CWD7_9DEIO|nr:glucose-6-phosphate dehydrogenase [Deinococcus roseus]GGJ27538.1 glucose-6-phosphate 1-dehydrogenase [Deinococcus roseus]